MARRRRCAERSRRQRRCLLVASPDRRDKLSVCGYLVDTWCLGVKNTIGPRRMGQRELDAFKHQYFGLWESEGIPVPLELARHLVLGAVDYARGLGFEPHPDFRRARRALGSWDGRSSITFGRDGTPLYINGPHDHPQRVLATLERAVGRGAFTTASPSVKPTASVTATATSPR